MKDSEFDEVLGRLVEISKRYGKNPGYVVGDGGSVAQKERGVMFIKDADKPLGSLSPTDFIMVDRNRLNDAFNYTYPDDSNKRDALIKAAANSAKLYKNDARRVGINALLHNLINYKYTLHVQPPLINALIVRENEAKRLIGADVITLPDAQEAYGLIDVCKSRLKSAREHTGKDAAVLLIQNHGVFLGGDTPEEIDRQMLRVMSGLEAFIESLPETEPILYDTRHIGQLVDSIAKCYNDNLILEFSSNKRILKFMAGNTGKRALCRPDVKGAGCCRPMYMTLTDTDKLKETFTGFVKTHGYLPRIICIPGAGAFAAASSKAECAKTMSSFMNRIKNAQHAENFDGFLHLTDKLISHILNYNTNGIGINKPVTD